VSNAVLEALQEEVRLRERIIELQNDVVTYRELAQEAIHALHELTTKHNRLREFHRELVAATRERPVRSEAA